MWIQVGISYLPTEKGLRTTKVIESIESMQITSKIQNRTHKLTTTFFGLDYWDNRKLQPETTDSHNYKRAGGAAANVWILNLQDEPECRYIVLLLSSVPIGLSESSFRMSFARIFLLPSARWVCRRDLGHSRYSLPISPYQVRLALFVRILIITASFFSPIILKWNF